MDPLEPNDLNRRAGWHAESFRGLPMKDMLRFLLGSLLLPGIAT